MTWTSVRRWWAIAFLIGVVAGVVWWAIADTATFIVTSDGVDLPDNEMREQFGVVAQFVIVGAVTSVLLGFVLGLTTNVSWPAVPIVAVLAGQAAVVAWLVGTFLGPGDPNPKAGVGARVNDSLGVDAVAPFVAWAVFGVAGLLLAVWWFDHGAGRDADPAVAPADDSDDEPAGDAVDATPEALADQH